MRMTITQAVLLGGAALLAARALQRRRRHYDLRGRTVLITGGARGLGLVLARQFAREGARVAICARDPQELQRAEAELAAGGAPVLALACDVGEREQVDAMVQRIQAHWGPVEVLVNNAGVVQAGPAEDMTLEDYEQAMRTHFWGPVHASLAVLPEMYRRGEGRIVNIASIGGKLAVPHLLPYSASKFALVGFSEGLRAELLKNGIYVTTVAPGLMRTGSVPNAQFKGRAAQEYTWFALSASLPGLSMQAERAAAQILRACRTGRAQVVLGVPARLGALAHGIAPGLVGDVLGLANRFLPRPGGLGRGVRSGRQARPAAMPRWATATTDRAARRNKEVQSTP